MYYNPLFCTNLKTNLGKEFLNLVDKQFPKSGMSNKILNRKTIKISCMPNLEKEISKDNLKVLGNNNKTSSSEERTCNCKFKDHCPVNGMCLTKGVKYKASEQ